MKPDEQDLFTKVEAPEGTSTAEHQVPPSESVYVDMGVEELFYIGEVQLPRPIPVELVVEVDGWDYVYTLTSRHKDKP